VAEAAVLAVVAIGGAWSALPACGDVIELKTGQKIEGEVLKDSGGEIVVDLGVDIVRIPASQIKSRQAKGEAAGDDADAKSETHEIYNTADLPVRTIKELTLKFGEGVVLVQTPSGLGSGFILDERGHCVTNYHVVEQETRIAVTIFHKNAAGEFVRRRIDDVAIVALNPFFDLALLQVPVQKDVKFQTVYLAKHNDQREGDEVFAIGNPLGLERSVSQGIISTRNRNFNGMTFIQTTAEINPGNSGGPLFNLRGEVVGVTNMKLLFSEGLGFAIPIAYVKHFLDNRDAFAFDKNNPNSGFRYLEAPRRKTFAAVPPAGSAASKSK
jgi:serine protease Do